MTLHTKRAAIYLSKGEQEHFNHFKIINLTLIKRSSLNARPSIPLFNLCFNVAIS